MLYQIQVNVASGTSARVFDLAEDVTCEEVISVLTMLGKVIGHRMPPEKSDLLNSLIGPNSGLRSGEASKNVPSSPPPSAPPTLPSPSRPSAASATEKKAKARIKKKLQTSAEVRRFI